MNDIVKAANFLKESQLMKLFKENPFDTTVRVVFYGGGFILAVAGQGIVLAKADISGSNFSKFKTIFDSSVKRALK